MTAPRPRVEGEAALRAALDTIKAEQPCPNVTTTLTALREMARQDSIYRGALYDTTTRAATVIEHQLAEVARLTAEVERLREIADDALLQAEMFDEHDPTVQSIRARLAALALPTPAPEATNDGK